LKLAGSLTVVLLIGLITLLMRNDRKKKMRVSWEAPKHA
jgi:hypothetical protein